METAMKDFDEQVRHALKGLQAVIPKSGQAPLEEARASYEELRRVHEEIIALSRRNTNMRSFALSLGQRRNVAAQCQETLSTLQQVLQSTTFKATR